MLKYVGNGRFLPGIPARDLTDEEAAQFNEKDLLKSGLYEKEKKAKEPKQEKKEGEE
jgi:hypothetical protein